MQGLREATVLQAGFSTVFTDLPDETERTEVFRSEVRKKLNLSGKQT